MMSENLIIRLWSSNIKTITILLIKEVILKRAVYLYKSIKPLRVDENKARNRPSY